MNNDLINRKHCKDFILRMTAEMRLEWNCTRVSKEALDDLNARIKILLMKSVKRHPTVGKTFRWLG